MFGIITRMNKKTFAEKIYNNYGPVTRARGTFLYTKKGIRLTDMFLEDGRGILGWEGGSAITFFKNYLSKGLTGSFICEDKSRLNKAIQTLLFSDRIIYYFSNKNDAVQAGSKFSPDSTAVYMPWNPQGTNWSQVDSVIIAPPLGWTDTVYILAVKTKVAGNTENEAAVSNQISIPFALEAAITKSIYNLIKEIQNRQEKDWFIYDPVLTKYWTRKGPYLYTKIPENKYDDFVNHCLECEIVINPDYNSPSIVPFGADKGVFTKLKNKPFTFQE